MKFEKAALWGLLAFGVALQTGTAAADYPTRPITVVIHATAGGGTDIMGRLLFEHVERRSGKTFVVENHPGAGGQIGFTRVALSPPDGYTIGAITTMSIVTHELTREGVVFRFAESFTPLAQIVLDPSVVVVRADSPLQSLEDLVEAASARPNTMTWGGTFLYGAHHVHYIMFNEETGAELTYVPFDGVADSRAALLGGHIDVAAGGFSEFASLHDSGDVRILVSAGSRGWDAYPEVPTYRDLGHDIVLGSNRGFVVPAGTPEDRVDWLKEHIEAVVQDEAFLADARTRGIATSLDYMPGAEFREYLIALQDRMREVLPEEAKVAN